MTDEQPPRDPRVYFAAERTFLAWIRTGLAFMGLGFVLARYRAFLPAADSNGAFSQALGVGLVLLGIFTIIAPTIQFRRFLKTLSAADRPAEYSTYPSTVTAACLAVLGLGLVVYLLLAGTSSGGP
jgi:putative membrane protein